MRKFLPLFVLAFAACESRVLVVESDAAWEGGIFDARGSEWVDGSGDARFAVEPTGEVCWFFEAERGTVRVFVEEQSITGPGARSEITEGQVADGCDG